jgi:hypothetical protein
VWRHSFRHSGVTGCLPFRSIAGRFRPGGRGFVFGPEDVVEHGWLGSVFAEAGEALSAMVLAVEDDVGQSFGNGGVGFERRQVES